jgi:hypothetical protein
VSKPFPPPFYFTPSRSTPRRTPALHRLPRPSWCYRRRPSHPLVPLDSFATFLASCRIKPHLFSWPGAPFPCLAGDPPPRAASFWFARRRSFTCRRHEPSDPPTMARIESIPPAYRSTRGQTHRAAYACPWSQIARSTALIRSGRTALRSVHRGPMDRVHRRSTVAPAARSMINDADRAQPRSIQSPAGYFAEKPPSFS